MNHKLEVGERRFRASNYTLTTGYYYCYKVILLGEKSTPGVFPLLKCRKSLLTQFLTPFKTKWQLEELSNGGHKGKRCPDAVLSAV